MKKKKTKRKLLERFEIDKEKLWFDKIKENDRHCGISVLIVAKTNIQLNDTENAMHFANFGKIEDQTLLDYIAN